MFNIRCFSLLAIVLCNIKSSVTELICTLFTDSPLSYYGDPLRDFSLGHFLDRFAFKNPKKPKTEENAEGEQVPKKKILGVAKRKGDYVSSGSRGLPVHSLTKDHCTEDEQYIFQ